MYFEAEMDSKRYSVEVQDQGHYWMVVIAPQGEGDSVTYRIDKTDFERKEEYYSFLHKGVSYLVDVLGKDGEYIIWTRNYARRVRIVNDQILLQQALKGNRASNQQKAIKAGLPGKIIQVYVNPGDVVRPNKPLLVMEAMKMENEIRSAVHGKIKAVHVQQGDSVEAGALLVEFE